MPFDNAVERDPNYLGVFLFSFKKTSLAFALPLLIAGSTAVGALADAAPAAAANGTINIYSGAVYEGANFTQVSASWKVPTTATCSSTEDSTAYIWVGLGGLSGADNDKLEQIGTAQWCRDGQKHYGLFAEFFPDGPIAGDGYEYPDYPVAAGDNVTATVTKADDDDFTITETNHTQNWTFSRTGHSQTQGGGTGQGTAEVVAEDPGGSLSNFGSVSFSGISASASDVSNPSYQLKDMKDGSGPTKATATSTSSGVKVTWQHI
ncbi:G1 family glutamic endopeptidase [Psychromicrobium lacuslunae]|uniref:G1 family glutamic endopeptidase n=1 Tax=Psychromicrobium lacuslunae TaxID=1618207 RepID=UPI000695ADE3|nr:G1 family glutamic endopeptidase [Psychromicrobium lacuslunae]